MSKVTAKKLSKGAGVSRKEARKYLKMKQIKRHKLMKRVRSKANKCGW
jgi:hypothetical protein